MGREHDPGTESGRLELPNVKEVLKAYYAGDRLVSPVGGVLRVLGVHPLEDGSAILTLECDTSWLRYEVPIRKATRTEKSKVGKAVKAGDDPVCPRHGRAQRLVRSGAHLVCPACGIPYRKVD